MNHTTIHPTATCEAHHVGPGTTVAENSHIGSQVSIGSWCQISSNVTIDGSVTIGNRVHIDLDVVITGPLVIGDDVRIGADCKLDLRPNQGQEAKITTISSGAVIEESCRILPGSRIGEQAVVGRGATVRKPVRPYEELRKDGESAQRSGIPPTSENLGSAVRISGAHEGRVGVGLAQLVALKEASDSRGTLIAADTQSGLPFQPTRYFTVSDVPDGERRGIHAHRVCHQFLVALRGEVHAIVADGAGCREVILDNPRKGLYVPPLIWGTQHSFSSDALLLVLASDVYDPADYIHHWQEFISLKI